MHRQHFFSDSAIFSQVGVQNHISAAVSLGFGKGFKSRANFNSPTSVLHLPINPSIKRQSPPTFPSHQIRPPFIEYLFHCLFIYSFTETWVFIRQGLVFHHLSVMPKTAPKEPISFPSQRKLFSWSEKYFFPVREIIFPRQGIFRGKNGGLSALPSAARKLAGITRLPNYKTEPDEYFFASYVIKSPAHGLWQKNF